MSENGGGEQPGPPKLEALESQASPLAAPGISISESPLRGRAMSSGMKVLLFWNRVAPFFVSAALFLSGFFSIFAPLPFLILGVSGHWAWLFAAALTNSALVYYTSGPTVFQFYLLAIVVVGVVVPLLVRRRWKPEGIVAGSWLIQWIAILGLVSAYAVRDHLTPWQEVVRMFSGFFDQLFANLSPQAREQIVESFGGGDAGAAEWRRRTLIELPGALGIFCLLITWFNLRILVNLNPNRALHKLGLDRRVFNRWKNPDWLIWPTLVSWVMLLLPRENISDIGLNLFKVLLAAYGLQGLAVIGMAFDAWKIRGLIRMFFYFLVLFLMMPLVLSIGFFDQWFDFRKKFRQI